MTDLVVGIDGSQAGADALDWAADEAVRRGLPLRIVHASLWETGGAHDEAGRADQGPFGDVHRAAHQRLAEAKDHALARHPALDVSAELVADFAVPALLAAGRTADLLVLGSHGRGAVEDLLHGSVGLRVLAQADFPVVLVHGPVPAEHRRIVLGVGPELCEEAGDFALAEAAARSAELDVVHAWKPDVDLSGFSVVMDAGAAQYRAEAQLGMAVDLLEEHAPPGVHLSGRTAATTATRALLDAAAQADLLVLGAREGHGRLGPVTLALLHHSPCPVAVVPVGATVPQTV